MVGRIGCVFNMRASSLLQKWGNKAMCHCLFGSFSFVEYVAV